MRTSRNWTTFRQNVFILPMPTGEVRCGVIIHLRGDFSSAPCCVPVFAVIKGALSGGFCCVQVNSVLKSLFSTFTRIQNTPASCAKILTEICRENKPFFFFCDVFKTQLENLNKFG